MKSTKKSVKTHLSVETQRTKLPPQAIDLEEAILGALLIEQDALWQVEEILYPTCFYRPAHQVIYEAILTLSERGEAVDVLTVTHQLRKEAKLEFIGGAIYLNQLTQQVNATSHLEAHARILLQQSLKRQLIQVGNRLVEQGYEDTQDVFDLLDAAEEEIFNLAEKNIRSQARTTGDLVQQSLDSILSSSGTGGVIGVQTGLSSLDQLTGGLGAGDLFILAGRPGMGKSSLMLTMARNMAVMFEHPVALFSLEMPSNQLMNRLLAIEGDLDGNSFKNVDLMSDAEKQKLWQSAQILADAPIFIDDTPALTIGELRARTRKYHRNHGVKVMFIDYIQRMGDTREKNETRDMEIGRITRGLKNIAQELNICVVALSQLSRAVEVRGGDKRPMLSDLRESGNIEADADIVAFTYRPEYYGFTQDEMGESTEGKAELMIQKHRNGALADLELKFIAKSTKFIEGKPHF